MCDTAYRHTKALVLGEEQHRTTFHVTCDKCKVSTIVFVSTGKMGVVSLGTMTDLSRTEAKRFFQNEAISSDHVIEVHEFLRDFSGGLGEFI